MGALRLVFASLLALSCSDAVHTGGAASGGAESGGAASGGVVSGTGGRVTGLGGASGAGGRLTGAGGRVTGAGGRVTGTGGAASGAGSESGGSMGGDPDPGMAGAGGKPPLRQPGSFGAFNFTLEALPVAAQVDLLLANGYEHISFWGPPNGNVSITSFWEDERVASGRLSITGVLYDVDVNQGPDQAATSELLGKLQGTKAALWLLFQGQANDERLVGLVREVAELAEARSVPVVLYPHHGMAIADAESANRIKLAAGRANVSISLHLCHELKAGHRDRLAEVIHSVIENVSIVTVNGADTDIGSEPHDWSHAIMPLDRGDFDVQEHYVRPLLEAGYDGPVVLHTFGIAEPPEEHYQRSARRWQSMMSALTAR